MATNPLSDFGSSILYLCAMLFFASLVLIFLKRYKFPFTIGLVVSGLLVGVLADAVPFLERETVHGDIILSHDLILYVLLPPLVYEASLTMDLRRLTRNLAPIMLLAFVGLVMSTLIVGVMLNWLTPLAIMPALVFGALISATDPVAVIALFKELGVPERLSLLMDGESLFNDATAIVMFQVMLALIATPSITDTTILLAIWEFVKVFFGGALVGVLVGIVTSAVAQLQPNNRDVQISLSMVAAWGSFVLADHYLELSGVMSCVAAGLVCSYYARTRLGVRTLLFADRWWSYVTFLANTYVFLLLGLKEELLIHHSTMALIWPLGAAIAVVLLARAVVIYSLIPAYSKIMVWCGKDNLVVSKAYQFIMFWGGLRGAVPIALVLSLPRDFPQYELIVNMTLAVILWTLLVQGTTMKPLCKRLLPMRNKTTSEASMK